MLYQLFIGFLGIGAFSFGGGYAVLYLIHEEIVERLAWITTQDFIDLVAIAEITPGPIAVNASTFVGHKVAGFPGACVGTAGFLLVPFCVTLVAFFYFEKFKALDSVKAILQGIRPAVIGLIAAAFLKVARVSFTDLKSVLIGVTIGIAIYKFDIHPILAIFLAGGMGVLLCG